MATSTTTSSSSGAAPAAARSPTRSPRPASGSCCSNAGDFLPREMENWDPEPVFVDGRYISTGHLVRRRRHARSSRRCTTTSAARRSSTAPRSTGCARRTSASCSTSTACRPRGRSATTTSSRTTRRPSGSTRCTATTARTRPKGHWSKQYPWPAVSHEPRIQELFDDLAVGRLPPVLARRAASCSTKPTARQSTCIRCTWCDGYPCLVHAKSDAETIAVRPILDLPNVTLLVNAEVTELETDAAGPHRHRRRRRRATAREETYDGRHRRGVGRARRTAPRLLLRSANDQHPNGLANGSDQVGRNYMFHNSKAVVALVEGAERHGVPEDARHQRLLLRRRRLRLARSGNIQMVGKSNAAAMKGEEPKLTMLAPHWSLADVAEHAVDFWLTTEDLPLPENRVTLDGDGNVAPRVHVDERRRSRPALPRAASKILNHVGHGRSTTCSTRTST